MSTETDTTKTTTPPADANNKAIAKFEQADGQIVTFDYGVDAGQGLQHANEGGLMPFVELLQPLSKIVMEKKVPGAQAGMFCIGRRLIDGEKGFECIGVFEDHKFVEWTPRDKGGGWVADHAPESPVVADARKNAKDRFKLFTTTGNALNDTFRLYCFIEGGTGGINIEQPDEMTAAVLPFDRTKMKTRQGIMDRLRMQKSAIPLYAVRIRVQAVLDKNKKGDNFYNYRLSFAVGDDLLKSLISPKDKGWAVWAQECRKLSGNIVEGKVKADTTAADAAPEGTDANGEDAPF